VSQVASASESHPAFEQALRRCQIINEPLALADAKSARYQSLYRLCALLAVTLGTVGMLLSIVSLVSNEGPPSRGRLLVEMALTASSLVVVLVGVFADVKRKWLSARNKAERYNLLRHRFLVDMRQWDGDGEFETTLADIGNETPDLANWVKQEPVPSFDATPVSDLRLLLVMLRHYAKERLTPQITFFKARSEAFERRVAWLRPLPVTLFYVSFACAAVSAALQASPDGSGVASRATSVVALGIALPVVSGAIRTLLLSRELARNSSRYAAKLHALSRLDISLTRALEKLEAGAVDVDQHAVLADVLRFEYLLESDHREWVRLMVEAEWY